MNNFVTILITQKHEKKQLTIRVCESCYTIQKKYGTISMREWPIKKSSHAILVPHPTEKVTKHQFSNVDITWTTNNNTILLVTLNPKFKGSTKNTVTMKENFMVESNPKIIFYKSLRWMEMNKSLCKVVSDCKLCDILFMKKPWFTSIQTVLQKKNLYIFKHLCNRLHIKFMAASSV